MTTAEKNTQMQIRCLISNVYDLQKLRISIGNRLVQSFYIQMGVAPSHKIDEADDVCKGMLNSLAHEYELISERMIASKYSLKKQIATIQKNGELQYIHNELDYKLVDEYMSMRKNENDTLKILTKYVHMHPLWDLFFKDIPGCGELMAANCIAYLDIEKARHVSSFWKYCGLDTVTSVNEDGTLETHGRRMGDTEEYEYTAADGTVKTKKGLTYNPALKSKLIGVLGGCFIKAGQRFGYNKYEECYRGYRLRLDNMPAHNEKTTGHKHNMAVRYMIKQFLRDLWVTWRSYEGYPVTEPYEVTYLGHKPHGYNAAQCMAANNPQG